MNKTLKKVLSVVLSLAMIFTSVTVYNTTAKAADETESATQETIDVDAINDWTQIGTTKDGDKAYISQATLDKFGNEGLRGFYDAGKTVGWNISTYMNSVPVFGFVAKDGNPSSVIIDGVRYLNDVDNTKAYVGSDCVYISQDTLAVPAGESEHVFIITAEGSGTGTFALKIVKLSDPTDASSVDISAWTECPAIGANASLVSGTYYLDTANYTANVNSAIWGTVGVATDTQYHGEADNCKIEGGAFTFAVSGAVGQPVGAVWINGKRYANASEMLHVRGDSVEIALSAFKKGINYFAIEGAAKTVTFAVKYVPAQEEVAPDQTLGEVTDYTKVCDVTGANDLSTEGTRYYVSEAVRNQYINYIDLFGIFTDHATANYHPAGCTLTGAAYVSSYPSVAGKIKSVWIDGVKYTSGTDECYIEGDQVHLAQSLFALPSGQDEKVFAVTVRSSEKDITYGVKVAKVAKFDVTVDGQTTEVTDGDTYTLPADAAYGYYSDGKMYKSGTAIKVTADMTFTSVNTLNVVAANGAAVKTSTPTGLKFQAKVTTDNTEAVKSDAITTGMLITANDLFENNDSDMSLTSAYKVLNIVNEGWANADTLTYFGAVANIVEANYERDFVARAYITVTYTNGESVTYYSNVAEKRNVSQVASRVIADANNGLSADELNVVASFIK